MSVIEKSRIPSNGIQYVKKIFYIDECNQKVNSNCILYNMRKRIG
ncbi:hypothetical protein [Cytobacillus dafuensis]|nr:hypothetical protein [Cytobacillus dafuensis]